MKKIISIIAIMLVFSSVVALSLTSCSKNEDENKIAEDECVLKIGENKVSYGVYRYFFLNYKGGYTEEQLNSAEKDKYYAEIDASAKRSIKSLYVIIDMAKGKGLSIDDKTVKSSVDSLIESIKESHISDKDKTGKKGYLAQLKENFMTEKVFRFVASVDELEKQLFMKMTCEDGELFMSEEDEKKIIEGDEYIRILQIYISADNGETAENNKKTAELVHKKAKTGENFDSLIGKYSSDFYMTSDGYYINHGYWSREMEEAAYALSIGEISDIIELSDGFHILKRLEKDSEYLTKNHDALIEQYQTSRFYDIVDEKEAALSVSETERFSDIDRTLVLLK